MDSYTEFLTRKITISERAGMDVDVEETHPSLFPHQKATVQWALRRGRALIAQNFGLGKTRVQCDIARLLHQRNGSKFLVVCPLGVKHQFAEVDGPAMGMDWQYVTSDAEIDGAETPYLITNYERVRDGKISSRHFAGVSLDEGATLRSLGSKTFHTFRELFAGVPYRFVCTATPSPNNYLELINYADFLDIMDRGQALTRFFKRDSTKAGHLTLYQSHERDFWLWLSSWALFLYRPSDLEYSDAGYDLPELRVHWHRLPTDHRRAWDMTDSWGQHKLLLDAAEGVAEASREARDTIDVRLAKAIDIIDQKPEAHWLIWHNLESERHAIEKAIPEAVTAYGSQKLELREQCILDFTNGKIKILATKPQIAGSGCNFQHHCSRAIVLAADYKFHDLIQAIHRIHRFQQARPVDVHIIYTEAQEAIAQTLERKWRQHDELTAKMQAIVKKHNLSTEALKGDLERKLGVNRQTYRGEKFTAVNNDCVIEMPNIDANTVGLVHTSIPFGNHYEYTINLEDFGHTADDDEFLEQMDFLIAELYRVLIPGRLAAIHVKDRILYGHQTDSGFMEVNPFSDKIVDRFRRHGFLYQGRRTIVTDVVRENNQTYRLGWTEMTEGDASKMGSGLPEYLLLFRKPPSSQDTARSDVPVLKSKSDYSRGRWQIDAHAYWRSNGNSLVLANRPYAHEAHVARLDHLDDKGNLPASYFVEPPISHNGWVWDDIMHMRGLNLNQSRRKRENHVCPLPLDIVTRTIRLYSNEGEIVLDPFAGIFTVPYVAIQLGRCGYGIELNAEYWEAGVEYCQDIEREINAPTLFDLSIFDKHRF